MKRSFPEYKRQPDYTLLSDEGGRLLNFRLWTGPWRAVFTVSQYSNPKWRQLWHVLMDKSFSDYGPGYRGSLWNFFYELTIKDRKTAILEVYEGPDSLDPCKTLELIRRGSDEVL